MARAGGQEEEEKAQQRRSQHLHFDRRSGVGLRDNPKERSTFARGRGIIAHLIKGALPAGGHLRAGGETED